MLPPPGERNGVSVNAPSVNGETNPGRYYFFSDFHFVQDTEAGQPVRLSAG